MGDYLDMVVKECKTSYNTTEAVLAVKGVKHTVRFSLPISVQLRKGDKIEFQTGAYANQMTHDMYSRATVHRNKEELLSFNSRDMIILTGLREAEGLQKNFIFK